MAKRTPARRNQIKQTAASTAPATIAQAFNDGDLKRFYTLWQTLYPQLAHSPDLLTQAERDIALAITDEGTPEASRLEAFREVVKEVNPYEYPSYWALSNTGTILNHFQHYYAAITKYEQALKFKSDEYIIFSNYGITLTGLKRYDEAIIKFEQALTSLERYSKQILTNSEQYNEKSLKLKHSFIYTLDNYGATLSDLGRHYEAIAKYEEALKLEPNFYECWDNYGITLAKLERYDEAIVKHKQALKLERKSTKVWLNYGQTLIEARQYKEAIKKFEHALTTPDADQFANYIYLNLGLLYYRTQKESQAKQYFDRLLEISDDKDKKKIEIAQNLLAIKYNNDEALDLLNEVMETSPHYKEACQLFGSHAAGKRFFDKFRTSDDDITVKDTQALNRSMYHKIANEVAILKELAYEVVADYPAQDALLQQILASIGRVLQGVQQRREAEKATIEIQQGNFEQVIRAIEQTAFEVSDFVNNECAIIEEEIRFALDDDPHAPRAALSELLNQIKITQVALNDLKAINEGITIKYSRFPVHDLFEVWLNNPHFAQATLSLDITNGESIFYGDKAKIKSMLNEFVENSLRHNPTKTALTIHMSARDELPPPKRLVITYQDNGIGIPLEHKAKIFLPLFTTSPSGSGLGLYIIKRTINQMHGQIVEKGAQGVLFEITIPYAKGEDL